MKVEEEGDYTYLYTVTTRMTPPFINPFTAPTCKISGLKDARTDTPANSRIFRSYDTPTFNIMHFDENPFKRHCEKKTKSFKGFKFRCFIGRFQMTSWQWRG